LAKYFKLKRVDSNLKRKIKSVGNMKNNKFEKTFVNFSIDIISYFDFMG
jgi:mannitol-specific phosphotransferase system IIBC component